MFLSRTVVWLSAKKIPFVLCGSRFSPALAHTDALTTDASGDACVAITASSSSSSSSSSSISASASSASSAFKSGVSDVSPTRRQKRNAFDAVVRFCAAHQHAVLRDVAPPRAGGVADRLVAVSAASLSCGQALLVASFLAESLLCRAEAPGALAGRVAALLHRAAQSDRLEAQPLPVLLSCAYALHRAAQGIEQRDPKDRS